MLRMILASALFVPIAGCTVTQGEPQTASTVTCTDSALNSFTGVKATQSSGAELLKASGARHLRWVGPGMAVTMDYRPDRLTVSYDEAMTITSARCG